MQVTNIMPMAGKGLRFSNSQYSRPKPFILIKKIPMFALASMSMPEGNKNIYLFLEENLNLFNDGKKYLDSQNTIPIKIKKITNGQAQTCLLAKDFIDDDEIVFIHSCDSYINFNSQVFKKLIKDNDLIIFTNKPSKHNIKNIDSYGWVSFKNKMITNITCKNQASENPKNDRVIIGSFAFRNKKIFLDCINNLINKKIKINKEYYLDMAAREALQMKMKVQFLDVKEYISWGTPDEFERSKDFKILRNKIISRNKL